MSRMRRTRVQDEQRVWPPPLKGISTSKRQDDDVLQPINEASEGLGRTPLRAMILLLGGSGGREGIRLPTDGQVLHLQIRQ